MDFKEFIQQEYAFPKKGRKSIYVSSDVRRGIVAEFGKKALKYFYKILQWVRPTEESGNYMVNLNSFLGLPEDSKGGKHSFEIEITPDEIRVLRGIPNGGHPLLKIHEPLLHKLTLGLAFEQEESLQEKYAVSIPEEGKKTIYIAPEVRRKIILLHDKDILDTFYKRLKAVKPGQKSGHYLISVYKDYWASTSFGFQRCFNVEIKPDEIRILNTLACPEMSHLPRLKMYDDKKSFLHKATFGFIP
jgi:hypothetical protein